MKAESLELAGPGQGPGGSPLAIAISPVLTGRDAFGSMRERILEAAPGTRLISVSAEGIADEPLDEVEVLLRGWSLGGDALDRLFGRAPKLRWIHSVSVGVESMLTPCVRLRGLTVTNGRGVFDQPIAEYVVTMILAICRRLPQLLELQRERTWQPIEAVELGQTTIGLVGLGGIGCEVARLAGPFGPRIVAVRRRPDAAPVAGVEVLGGLDALPELLAVSDFVVLALPLTAETEALIDDEALAQFKRELGSSTSRAGRSSTSWRCCGRFASAPSAAPSWTRSARSRCPRPRRSTGCPTASSRRTRAGRARPSWIALSTSSATTCAATAPASRSSTWSIRRPATRTGRPLACAGAQAPREEATSTCRSPSSGWPARGRRPSSTP